MSSLYCSLGIPALLSVICIAVGVFSPAWLIYSMRIDTQTNETASGSDFDERVGLSSGSDYATSVDLDMEIWMGLWTMRACYRSHDFETCATVSVAQLQEALSSQSGLSKAGNQKFLGDWLALQILTVCSLLCAGFGLICIYIMGKATDDKKRNYGYMTAIGWLLTGIFILAAVGKQATEYNTYHLGADVVNQQTDGQLSLEFHTPWAIIVAGIGGAWAAVATVITVLYLIFKKQQRPSGNSTFTLLPGKVDS